MKNLVHLETLTTDIFYDKDAKYVLNQLDELINFYCGVEKCEVLSVCEYGFQPTKKGNGIRGYARIAVTVPREYPEDDISFEAAKERGEEIVTDEEYEVDPETGEKKKKPVPFRSNIRI